MIYNSSFIIPYVNGSTAPPETVSIYGRNVQLPQLPPLQKYNYSSLQFNTATTLPALKLPDGCNECRWGWGWGWGARAGAGQAAGGAGAGGAGSAGKAA